MNKCGEIFLSTNGASVESYVFNEREFLHSSRDGKAGTFSSKDAKFKDNKLVEFPE